MQARKASLSSMDSSFDHFVSIDHLHFCGLRDLRIMDSSMRNSTGAVFDFMSMLESIMKFEPQWVVPFLYPQTVLYDPAFDNGAFTRYLRMCEVI